MPESVVALNVFYFWPTFAEGQADDVVAAAIETWIETLFDQIDQILANDSVLGSLYVYVHGAGEWDLVATQAPTKAFTSAQEILPHGTAALVRAYTDNPRVIGRKYIPGLTEQAMVTGAWNSTVLTALAAYAARWVASQTVSTGNTLAPAVWSTVDLELYLLSGDTVVPAYPAYQRRRRPGAGS